MKRSQFGPIGWPEQWLRVQRWYERVTPILAAPPLPRTPIEAQAADDVFAFFMNCYHLKDWLKNDQADPHPEAEKLVEDTEALRVCRDLCNGLKHAILRSKKYPPTYQNLTTTAEVTHDSAEPAVRWLIVVKDGDERDMSTVADQCGEAWRGFIAGLPKARYFE